MNYSFLVLDAFDMDCDPDNLSRTVKNNIRLGLSNYCNTFKYSLKGKGYVKECGAYMIPGTDRFFVVCRVTFPNKIEYNKLKLLDEFYFARKLIDRGVYSYDSNKEWINDHCQVDISGQYEHQNS